MQIIIKKKFLILVEISENIYRAFLVVVNFIFEYVENSVQKCEDIFEKAKENAVTFYGDVVNGARRFLYSIFNIRKIELIKIKNSYNVKNNFVFITKNSDRVRYANLLAPPNIF